MTGFPIKEGIQKVIFVALMLEPIPLSFGKKKKCFLSGAKKKQFGGIK